MIVCVCGMIGAGKLEYARRSGETISDFDEIGNKEKQVDFTVNNHEKIGTIYHITCFPTQIEEERFKKEDVKYIWINTTFTQCRKNILGRRRRRDMENIQEAMEKNRKIQEKYMKSDIKFEMVDLFETDERW